ncbi:hypothetical protein LPJ75_001445, partial [Coemansia sp. RSA 2598]
QLEGYAAVRRTVYGAAVCYWGDGGSGRDICQRGYVPLGMERRPADPGTGSEQPSVPGKQGKDIGRM